MQRFLCSPERDNPAPIIWEDPAITPSQLPSWFRWENKAPRVGRNSFRVKTVWSGGCEETPGSWTERTCRRCWCQACRGGVGTGPRHFRALVES